MEDAEDDDDAMDDHTSDSWSNGNVVVSSISLSLARCVPAYRCLYCTCSHCYNSVISVRRTFDMVRLGITTGSTGVSANGTDSSHSFVFLSV